MKWYVYVAQCRDGYLYTGITTDLNRRIIEHNTNDTLGAKSLRGKRPVYMVYSETCDSLRKALKREKEIKGWRREKKLVLINQIITPRGSP